MIDIWILVANARRARIFSAKNSHSADLKEVETLANPGLHLPERKLVSDKPGRSFDRVGEGRHAMEEPSARDHEMEDFARRISRHLEAAYQGKNFSRLVIVAAPAFLGYFRKHVSSKLLSAISLQIDKDLTLLPPAELRTHLPEKLAPMIPPA